jgi:hypothetical protein
MAIAEQSPGKPAPGYVGASTGKSRIHKDDRGALKRLDLITDPLDPTALWMGIGVHLSVPSAGRHITYLSRGPTPFSV